jgi:hypothetical protein
VCQDDKSKKISFPGWHSNVHDKDVDCHVSSAFASPPRKDELARSVVVSEKVWVKNAGSILQDFLRFSLKIQEVDSFSMKTFVKGCQLLFIK